NCEGIPVPALFRHSLFAIRYLAIHFSPPNRLSLGRDRLSFIALLVQPPMSYNTFGHLFRVTTWGESHGPAIGCVVDGCPPGIPLTAEDIQVYLDRRRPGQSRCTSQRRAPDQADILPGGVTDDDRRQVTTGPPISLVIPQLA